MRVTIIPSDIVFRINTSKQKNSITMSPNVPLLKKSDAESIFNKQRFKYSDCKLKKLTQFQCLPNAKMEFTCIPFVRLFEECEMKLFDESGKEIKRRVKIEQTTLKSSNQVEQASVDDIKEFSRNQKLYNTIIGEASNDM